MFSVQPKRTALQGVIDAASRPDGWTRRSLLIVSSKPGAPILDRAAKHRIQSLLIDPAGLTRSLRPKKSRRRSGRPGLDLRLLIGYMRIVSPAFVKAWEGRLLNVHPSLLLAFGGKMNKDVHRAVLDSSVKNHRLHLGTYSDGRGGMPDRSCCKRNAMSCRATRSVA